MVEEIPAGDCVTRIVDSPHKWRPEEREFVDATLFEFPGGEPESVVWRKYKPDIADVHSMGCERQREKRAAGRDSWTYEGAITAQVKAIRDIATPEGGFAVEHAPDEGQWHVHVSMRAADGVKLNKAHKMNLKEHLRRAFTALEAHKCAS